MSVSIKPLHEDPLFFDREDLYSIAEEASIHQGLRIFKEHRVLDIDQDQCRLWASVEDEEVQRCCALDVQIALQEENGELLLTCSCEESTLKVCSHQVAVLYAYADMKESSDQLISASATAITDRIKRGRAEVKVEPVSGDSVFGIWRAESMSSATHFPQQYRVTIRSLQRRSNICSCPDFQHNQLGTCKHIEAVLHKIAKLPGYDRLRQAPAPVPYVYMAWDVEDAPRISLHRSSNISAELSALLDEYFDAEGRYTRRMPDDFFRFAERVENRSDIHLGEDAMGFAQHMAASAAHRLRAEKIRAQIAAGNGRLPGVKATLYSYQVEGAAFLAGMGRALLADDMGLGKTLQAIAAAVWLKEHEGLRKILIVCPASLKQQWAREIERFTDLAAQQVQGNVAERTVQYRSSATFFIVNYELVLRDRTLLTETLKPDLIIMDEAQRIKNWRTKIAAAVKMIPSRYAFVLTGTPLENRLEDLYSLMQVVDQKILGPLWRYLIDFHITDERGKVLGYRNLSLLRKRLAPVMLRRDRRLVRDQLPDRINQRIDVGMTPPQRDLHDAAMSNAGALATIAKKRPLTPSEQNRLLASLQQARMACNAAGLVDKETQGSPKLDELVDLLDELCIQSGLKAVVFSQWERMTAMAEARLRRMGLGCVRLHGSVPTAQRGALMDRFRDDDSIQVFISTDAGGVGLNLQSGAVLINLDVPWNPAVLEQRNARIHRLGQTRKVQIITMIAANSYEEQVFALIQNKQNLFDHVVGEDASEDVVGVSKKLLETLLEDLGREAASSAPGEDEILVQQEEETLEVVLTAPVACEEPTISELKQSKPVDRALEEAITACIVELQRTFGRRIERILGSKGGLLVVLDRVDEEADNVAVRLSETIPVALLDRLALNGLQRLGAASPLADAHAYYDAATEAPVGPSRLQQMAVEKLRAARLLLDQQMGDSALDLIVNALLAISADRAGRATPLAREEAGIWAYSEALPQAILTPQEVALLMQAIGLSQGKNVPLSLIRDLVENVAVFAGGCIC
jgi:superfamily II DNA or RNA helicase